jgi:hypothetical protein
LKKRHWWKNYFHISIEDQGEMEFENKAVFQKEGIRKIAAKAFS